MVWKSVLLASLFWLCGVFGTFAADLVVLASPDAQGLPKRGDRIESDRKLVLADGQVIVGILRSGKVLRIAGPFSGRLRDHLELDETDGRNKQSAALDVVSALLSDDKLIATLGSSRSSNSKDAIPVSASAWEPFIIGTGAFCLDVNRPVIRRQRTKKAVRLTLTSPEFEFADFVWPAGQGALQLSDSVIREGARYAVLLSDRTGDSFIFTRPADLGENAAGEIAWLSETGCVRQARRLVRQLIQLAN